MWDSLASCQNDPAFRNAICIRVPSGMQSKQKLLGLFAKPLRFPKYFGWNWDAFEECLHDLSWLPEQQPIVVMHAALPFSDGENRQIYLDILQKWRAAHASSVRICLP
jgi:hypothetical protein